MLMMRGLCWALASVLCAAASAMEAAEDSPVWRAEMVEDTGKRHCSTPTGRRRRECADIVISTVND